MGFIDSFPSFCLERFGLYLWQGRGEMDSEADAGVFQDRFRHFRTTRFVRKGYFFFFFVTFGLQIVHVALFEGEKPMKVANQFSI